MLFCHMMSILHPLSFSPGLKTRSTSGCFGICWPCLWAIMHGYKPVSHTYRCPWGANFKLEIDEKKHTTKNGSNTWMKKANVKFLHASSRPGLNGVCLIHQPPLPHFILKCASIPCFSTTWAIKPHCSHTKHFHSWKNRPIVHFYLFESTFFHKISLLEVLIF